MPKEKTECLYVRLPIGERKKLKVIAKAHGFNTVRAYLENHIKELYPKIPQSFVDSIK